MWSINIADVEAIDIESTTFCNLRCPECNRETSKEWLGNVLNTTHLTPTQCKEWFNPTELTGLNEIKFCGAIDESAANPYLFEIINYFTQNWNDMFIDIRTNGSLKTTAWWEKLAQTLPSNHSVSFGIDGSDEVSELYRVGSSFKKVINNATAFIKAGGLADWQFIEFEHNKHQIEEALQKSKDLGFKSFNVMSSSRDNESGEVEHTIGGKDISPVQKGSSDPRKKEISVKVKVLKKTKNVITCENQNSMGKRILVNSLGLVTPCCFLNGYIHFPVHWEMHRNKPENLKLGLPGFNFDDPVFNKIYKKNSIDAISLHHNTLKNILEGEFFSDIEASWTSAKPVRRCSEVCGDKVVDSTKFWVSN